MKITTTRTFREWCESAVHTLPIPAPFTLEGFLEQVGDHSGRRIELLPAILGATAPCGMLVGTDDVDYICFAANTSPLHRRHIVLHEVGHLWLAHKGTTVALDSTPIAVSGVASTDPTADAAEDLGDSALAALKTLLPDLPEAVIKRIMGRTVFDKREEREAELFALLAGPALTRAARIPAQPRDNVLERIREVFDAPAAGYGARG
ncbi:hypothetical protein [Amycolatopsis sp. RTGN1]|uniref:hypothetical protein n=1 Tax=Amycolatopsis ponsaeliensis TaxID=2992142 RepID=UPI0025503957|nr:hypothetical protein [Amycolatopsis sp. RTGN1]